MFKVAHADSAGPDPTVAALEAILGEVAEQNQGNEQVAKLAADCKNFVSTFEKRNRLLSCQPINVFLCLFTLGGFSGQAFFFYGTKS